jgi:2,5-diamino-6-(ribosylamino)-4(3H)-pyrimidinone 5'-phosphate reductase
MEGHGDDCLGELLLEGGGKISGSFLAANLIDELSILVAPVADGSIGTPSLFDVADRRVDAHKLKLLSIEKRSGGIVWLRYKVRLRWKSSRS